MSRFLKSANVLLSVTMYCTVLTFEFSIVGLKRQHPVRDREPDPRRRVSSCAEALLRATSMQDCAPGPPGAASDARAGGVATAVAAPAPRHTANAAAATIRHAQPDKRATQTGRLGRWPTTRVRPRRRPFSCPPVRTSASAPQPYLAASQILPLLNASRPGTPTSPDPRENSLRLRPAEHRGRPGALRGTARCDVRA